ncbi:MAG: alpha/beta hydrolase, partial [Actinobacteria bacterium]|nr:alpha/beta hydrolase [Actinomycetota bacterium]
MLAFSSSGQGERVVLVHGFTQTSETWNGAINRLA